MVKAGGLNLILETHVVEGGNQLTKSYAHIHTDRHTYVYTYVFLCVCMYVCMVVEEVGPVL